MTYNKTIWVDQEVKKERTYELINNSDGTTTIQDPPNNILTFGTPVNAQNLNNIENGIEDHEIRISLLEGIGNPIPTLSNILGENEIWLEGAEISRTTYAALFEIYGTTYGEGDLHFLKYMVQPMAKGMVQQLLICLILETEPFGAQRILAILKQVCQILQGRQKQVHIIPHIVVLCILHLKTVHILPLLTAKPECMTQLLILMPLFHLQYMVIQQPFNRQQLSLELKQDSLKKRKE